MAMNEEAYYRNKEQGYRFFQPDAIPSSYINAPRLSRDVYGGSIPREEFTVDNKVKTFFSSLFTIIIALVAISFFIG